MSFQSYTQQGLYVLRWGAKPEVKDVDLYHAEIASAHKIQGEQPVGIIIMPEDSAPPDGDFKKAQAAQIPDIMGHLQYAVCVFEGEGFMASMKRSALIGILLLSGRRYPVHVRATIREALITKPAGPTRFNVPLALSEIQKRGLAKASA